MRISSRREYVWSLKQNRYILVRDVSSIIRTEIGWCKGASAAQNSLAASQTQFYNTLSSDYNTQFANQSSILGALNNSLSPIVAAGPNQFGFSGAQTANLNAQAIQGTGQQYANASKALGAQQAAQGGGNSYLPTGAQGAQQAGLASASAAQASNELLGIQQAGYNQGHSQYESAIGQLGTVAGMYDPTGYAGQATSSGNAAASEQNLITQENNAASPWNLVGGILGGVAGSILGPAGSAIGSKLGSAIGGLGGNGGPSTGGGEDD